jgi:galactokinase
VELAPRSDHLVRAYSVELASSDAEIAEYRLGEEAPRRSWIDYVQGTTQILRSAGHSISGFEVRIRSDLPIGAGLASSAALEISLLRALCSAFALELDPIAAAYLGQRVETDFIGAPTGLMDQICASAGVLDAALFLDTRTLIYEQRPIPADWELIVIHSGQVHAHGSGDYRVRRCECDEAARALGVAKLREADPADVERLASLVHRKRARHVVTENIRVIDAANALTSGDGRRLGALFAASHASMRDDFEISTPEIDALVALANAEPDVFGARLTGGGFGGSIVALARAGRAREAADRIAAAFGSRTSRRPSIVLPRSNSNPPVEM